MGKSTSSSTKQTYMPGQKEAYQALLGGAMGQLGLGGTQAYTQPVSGWDRLKQRSGKYQAQPYQQPAAGNIFDILAQPYTGQFTAPLSEGEQYGIDWMKKVLAGEYDPRTSDYYTGMRESAYENLEKALTGIRQSAALGGMLASTPRIGQEAELQRKTASDLNTLLGGMYETERGRMQELVPQYMEAAGLERGIQQEELNKRYAEFVRQLQALGIPLQTALQLVGYSSTGSTTTQTGDPLAGIGTLIGALLLM